MHKLTRSKYQLIMGALLFLASVLCFILKKVHLYVTGVQTYSFLIFNLFLAWIPFFAAVLAYLTHKRRAMFMLIMPICTIVWLIFFPNATYLLTDFQHLSYTHSSAPLWFDVVMFIWFAWTGLMLGIASLYLMQEIITDLFSPWLGWAFAITATILSSLGVYLGRFMRWNSWDLLYEPIPIAKDMVDIVRHPITNLPTYVFTILFTLLFLFIYITIHLFGNISRERSKA